MLRVGTCSWKYPSWKGLVYSRATGIDYLAEYSRRYTTVEVDQWFWAPPEPDTAAQYTSVTPPEFRFTVKLPNTLSLTHFYRRKGDAALRPNPQFLSVEHYRDVLSRLEPMRPKIGMLMLQFEYLNRQKIEGAGALRNALASFAEAAPRDIPLAVEIRNPRWLDASWFSFLADHGLSPVLLQGYYMGSVDDTWGQHGSLVRGDVVVRLHGPDREGMEKLTGESWGRIVAPRDEELDRVAAMIADMRGRSLTVWLNVNNHYEGSAPLTIERLSARGIAAG